MKDLGLLADGKIIIGDRVFDVGAGDRIVVRDNLGDALLEAKLAAEFPEKEAFKELF